MRNMTKIRIFRIGEGDIHLELISIEEILKTRKVRRLSKLIFKASTKDSCTEEEEFKIDIIDKMKIKSLKHDWYKFDYKNLFFNVFY
mmetsp:Transcript_27891/g.24675  ORF Transcript_27891/g.24675 Transcript_27891/m.24675 type:complete len:87 (+) Transcript_27891:873-1133(+)